MMTLKVHRRRLKTLPTSFGLHRAVKVGFPKENPKTHERYPPDSNSKSKKTRSPATVLEVAVYNHFGTQKNGKTHIPSRPFLLLAMQENLPEYRRMIRKIAPMVLRGEVSLDQVLSQLGSKAQNDVQLKIRNLREPANAPSTVRSKGSSNPLIDSGIMRRNVTYKKVS